MTHNRTTNNEQPTPAINPSNKVHRSHTLHRSSPSFPQTRISHRSSPSFPQYWGKEGWGARGPHPNIHVNSFF